MAKPQPSSTAIRRKIRDFALNKGMAPERVELAVANFALLQILVSAQELHKVAFYLKGGQAAVLRLGMIESRATRDLDLSFRANRNVIRQAIAGVVGQSWGPFTISSAREVNSGTPANISEDLKLVRYFVHVGIGNSSWRRVILEASPSLEIEWTVEFCALSNDLRSLLGSIVDLKIAAIPSISVEQQMAEKLHAVTAPGSRRGHDIYDLFMSATNHEVNISDLARATVSVFTSRATHPIPLSITTNESLRAEYVRQVGDVASAPAFEEAATLVNELLAVINGNQKTGASLRRTIGLK